MKKFVSIVLILTMAVSLAGVSAFATPIDINKECMHLNDMLEHGYWTNGKKPVCDCDSCQVVLADYDHLDQIFDSKNALIFSEDMVKNLESHIKEGNWRQGNYLLMFYDRKNKTSYASFNKKDQNFSFEDLNEEDKNTYQSVLEKFNETIQAIKNGDPNNEKALHIRGARLVEALNQCDIESYEVLDKANKVKKGTLILGVIVSLLPFFKGLKKSWDIPVPKSIEDRYTGKSNLINWEDEIQYTGKILLPFVGSIILSMCIIFSTNKLGDYVSNKIITSHTCPLYIDNFPKSN